MTSRLHSSSSDVVRDQVGVHFKAICSSRADVRNLMSYFFVVQVFPWFLKNESNPAFLCRTDVCYSTPACRREVNNIRWGGFLAQARCGIHFLCKRATAQNSTAYRWYFHKDRVIINHVYGTPSKGEAQRENTGWLYSSPHCHPPHNPLTTVPVDHNLESITHKQPPYTERDNDHENLHK